MKQRRLFWFILAMAAALPIAAQTDSAVSAPYVTGLRGELRNNLVRISWVDSPDARGPVYLFRSVIPFGADGPLPGSRPVEIPYGVQSFVDELENGDSYYYFAAAGDEIGRYFNILIPDSNTIRISLAAGNSVLSVHTPDTLPEETRIGPPPGISSFNAAAQSDRVIISFTAADVKSAALYRSVRPIRATPDLLGAVIVQTGIVSPFTDRPVQGIPYYYAVIAEEDLNRGTVEIIPGGNTSLFPVEISSPGSSGPDSFGREIRAMPLPQISVQAAVPGVRINRTAISGNDIYGSTPPAELSTEAAMALSNIAARQQDAAPLKKTRVFARDLEAVPAGGEDYALSLIIRGSFSAKNWEAARYELLRFLALPRNPENAARARFYLGQCWYYLRQPREGLFEFLAIQDRYPAESAEWIQASLDMMRN